MTCHHGPGDTSCSSYQSFAPLTPDSSNYTIEDVCRVGQNVVLKVKYPNCSNCAYEGNKVMVFLNVTETQILRWKKIDPHFRDPVRAILSSEAPSPAARFPASPEGWKDAIQY